MNAPSFTALLDSVSRAAHGYLDEPNDEARHLAVHVAVEELRTQLARLRPTVTHNEAIAALNIGMQAAGEQPMGYQSHLAKELCNALRQLGVQVVG